MNQDKLQVCLHIPPLMWNKFRRAMLGVRQGEEEVIGFFLCQRQQLAEKIRYIAKAWVVPSPECYEYQSTDGLVLKQSFHYYLLDTYLKKRPLEPKITRSDDNIYDDIWSDRDNEKSFSSNTLTSNTALDVVHIHTHFGFETPQFSDTDDRYEAQYARFLAANYGSRLISGVFNESIDEYRFRLWDCGGAYHTPVKFYDSWFTIDRSVNDKKVNHQIDFDTESMFAKQQVFGETVQQQLGQLKVALIGCGGIGAVFAEQLARLGVNKWILIDGDRLETSNLNRMPGATYQMVEQCWYKVDYLQHQIARVYPANSDVKTMTAFVEADLTEVADADLIVVATDNHRSRQIVQELALKYLRPLICLGTHIELNPDLTPRMYCRVTVPPLGGGWCLMCGNIINLQQAALESAPQAIADVANRAGYIQGISDPAVFWLNGICASTGVGIVHSMLSGLLDLDAGLDWIYNFPASQWLKTNTHHLTNPCCYFCSSELA